MKYKVERQYGYENDLEKALKHWSDDGWEIIGVTSTSPGSNGWIHWIYMRKPAR